MPTNILQFQADLAKFAADMDVSYATAVRKVALSLHDRIVQRTPVDTGRARSSWTLQIDTADTATQPESVQYSPAQAASIATGLAASRITGLTDAAPYRDVWIANNVPYIEKLEGGSSKQAPSGMVAISLAEEEAEIAAGP